MCCTLGEFSQAGGLKAVILKPFHYEVRLYNYRQSEKVLENED